MPTKTVIRWTSAAALGAAFICGSAGTASAVTASPGGKENCERLAGLKIDAGAISLPTSGAEVTDATFVEAARADNSNGEFCQVKGAIDPVDRNAPKILWQVNLPTHWNKKALQMGGGGYNGSIPDKASTRAPVGQGNDAPCGCRPLLIVDNPAFHSSAARHGSIAGSC